MLEDSGRHPRRTRTTTWPPPPTASCATPGIDIRHRRARHRQCATTTPRRAVVSYDADGAEAAVEADAVLAAAGRDPATPGLGLDAAGIAHRRTGRRRRRRAPAHQPAAHLRRRRRQRRPPVHLRLARRQPDRARPAHRQRERGRRPTASPCRRPLFMTPPLARVGTHRTGGASSRAAGQGRGQARRATSPAMPRADDRRETPRPDEVRHRRRHRRDPRRRAAVHRLAGADQPGRACDAPPVTAAELRDTIFTHPTSTEAIGEVLSARRPARAKPPMPAVTGVPS